MADLAAGLAGADRHAVLLRLLPKDSIIEAVAASHLSAAGFAYFAVVAGVFVTAFYSFRMYFLVFHGKERWMENHGSHHEHHGDSDEEEVSHDHHHGLGPNDKPHESPWVVTLPLVLLAIPSVLVGYFAIDKLVYGDFFKGVISVNNEAHLAWKSWRTSSTAQPP